MIRRSTSSLVLATLIASIVGVSVACSDSDTGGDASVDAGAADTGATLTDSGLVSDTGAAPPDSGDVVDSGDSDDGATQDDAGDDDAGDNDASTDAGTDADAGPPCATVAGVYALTGTCNAPGFSPPGILCVGQTTCALTGTDDSPGQVFTGTVTETTLSATTESPLHEECTSPLTAGQLGTFTCNAAAVGLTCTATPTRLTISDATSYCCDVLAQDCGTGSRCTPRGTLANLALVNACVPDRGTGNLNDACTRASTAASDIGNDDCQKGLFCANLDQPTSSNRICRKLCAKSADCAVTEGCYAIGASTAGLCVNRCSIFSPSGTTVCGTGNTCRVKSSWTASGTVLDTGCDFAGAGAASTTCTADSDCGAGLGCNAAKKCSAYCDGTHACATGTCTAVTGAGAVGFEPTTGLCN